MGRRQAARRSGAKVSSRTRLWTLALRLDNAGALPTCPKNRNSNNNCAQLDLVKLGDRNGQESNYENHRSGPATGPLSIGLLTETSFAQTPCPTLHAQVTGSVPPSDVLMTPPPAPVAAVPSSGILVTIESRTSNPPQLGEATTTTRLPADPKRSSRSNCVPVRAHRWTG